MAMSPGGQAIVGGTVLRIPAIQSPNYVPGVSGWIVNIDGSAEFNSGTFRGSIEVGSLSGAHFIVNNSATGDVVDVYNASNQLVFAITAAGDVKSLSALDTRNAVLTGAVLEFLDSAQTPQIPPEIAAAITANQTSLTVDGGAPQNAVGGIAPAVLTLFTGDALTSPWIEAVQRGISGALIQSDQALNSNQLHHLETYTVTTGPGGDSAFAHHCSFTPTFGFLVGINGVGANFPFQYAWFANPFTSTTAHAVFTNNLGANLANTTLGVMGEFWG
jgi:hypothetical protein